MLLARVELAKTPASGQKWRTIQAGNVEPHDEDVIVGFRPRSRFEQDWGGSTSHDSTPREQICGKSNQHALLPQAQSTTTNVLNGTVRCCATTRATPEGMVHIQRTCEWSTLLCCAISECEEEYKDDVGRMPLDALMCTTHAQGQLPMCCQQRMYCNFM